MITLEIVQAEVIFYGEIQSKKRDITGLDLYLSVKL